MAQEPKPVTLVVIDPVKIDGKHVAVGDILTDIDYELAVELTGAGRTRLATDDDIAAALDAAKAAAKPAKS